MLFFLPEIAFLFSHSGKIPPKVYKHSLDNSSFWKFEFYLKPIFLHPF
jgi:hypothetical protein